MPPYSRLLYDSHIAVSSRIIKANDRDNFMERKNWFLWSSKCLVFIIIACIYTFISSFTSVNEWRSFNEKRSTKLHPTKAFNLNPELFHLWPDMEHDMLRFFIYVFPPPSLFINSGEMRQIIFWLKLSTILLRNIMVKLFVIFFVYEYTKR